MAAREGREGSLQTCLEPARRTLTDIILHRSLEEVVHVLPSPGRPWHWSLVQPLNQSSADTRAQRHRPSRGPRSEGGQSGRRTPRRQHTQASSASSTLAQFTENSTLTACTKHTRGWQLPERSSRWSHTIPPSYGALFSAKYLPHFLFQYLSKSCGGQATVTLVTVASI